MIDERILNELFVELMRKGESITFRVVTGSMSPLFAVGEQVVVEDLKAHPAHLNVNVRNVNVRFGDIVLFKTDAGSFLVH